MKHNCILVVDDDKDLRDMVVDYLEEEGFNTLQAESGNIAFKYIEQEKPNLILLDIEMPAGNGLDVCRTLKAQPSTSSIPVIIVSGSISMNNMISGCIAGVRLFLSKPFALSELGECIQNVLHQHDIRDRQNIKSIFQEIGMILQSLINIMARTAGVFKKAIFQ